MKYQLSYSMYCQMNFTVYYTYQDSKSSQHLLSTLLIHFKLVYEPFEQSNMHSTLEFCPRPARKEKNVREVESLLSYQRPSILVRFMTFHQLGTKMTGHLDEIDFYESTFMRKTKKFLLEVLLKVLLAQLQYCQMNFTV